MARWLRKKFKIHVVPHWRDNRRRRCGFWLHNIYWWVWYSEVVFIIILHTFWVISLMIWILYIVGASITACRRTGRYIVVLKEDKEIFNTLLLPMKKTAPTVVTTEAPAVVETSQDPDAMAVVSQKFIKKTRPCKWVQIILNSRYRLFVCWL